MTDRAVSTALGYVLGLAIVTALITGLFITTNEIVTDQQERAIRAEMTVIGNRLAADVTTVDRLALSADNVSVRLSRSLPTSVAGASYQVKLRSNGTRPATIELSTSNPEVEVTVSVMNGTAVRNTTVSGGDVVITSDGDEVVMDHG